MHSNNIPHQPMPQQPPPHVPQPDALSSSSSSNPVFLPYHTTKHRVTKGRYITSNDPRGYIPVYVDGSTPPASGSNSATNAFPGAQTLNSYEYPLNGQWVMMDVDDGYVLWTGIWKALGNAKADIVKMIESQPELEQQLRRVRGGYLKIQGTWMPYEVALRLARRVAWPIREDLIPLFGPTFPSTCLSPDQPGYGQVLDNAGRRRRRGPNQASLSKAAAKEQQNASAAAAAALYAQRHPPSAYPPQHGRQRPHSPEYHSSLHHPTFSPPIGARHSQQQAGPSYETSHTHHSSHFPTRLPPPPPRSAEHYPYSPRLSNTDSSHSVGRERQGSDSRPRYSPYPPPAPMPHYSYANAPQQGGGFDLPPISSIAMGQTLSTGGSMRPLLDRALPPIESLREGQMPSMDTTSVLRRLRTEEPPVHHADSNPPPTITPLGIARHRDMPSDQYLQTRRRSSSAPPLQPLPAFGATSHVRSTDRGYDDYQKPMSSSSYQHTSSMRHGHHPSQSGSGNPFPPRSSTSGLPYRDESQLGPPIDAYPSGSTLTRVSSSSSFWTQQQSPTPSSIPTDPSPISPASSHPWSPSVASKRQPSSSGPFVAISVGGSSQNASPLREDDTASEVSSISSSHSSPYSVRNSHHGPVTRSPVSLTRPPYYRPGSPMDMSQEDVVEVATSNSRSEVLPPPSSPSSIRRSGTSNTSPPSQSQTRAPIRPW